MTTITVLNLLLEKYKEYLRYANDHTLKETMQHYQSYKFGLCEQLGHLYNSIELPGRLQYLDAIELTIFELKLYKVNIKIRREWIDIINDYWFPTSDHCATKRELIRHCLNPRIRLIKLVIKEKTKFN